MSEGAQKKQEKPRKFQAIRGTRDLLPPDTALWNHVEQTAREVFSSFGYGEIRPPIFEWTELFARSIGSHTDVVSKEMYIFEVQHDSETGLDLSYRREKLLWMTVSSSDAPAIDHFADGIQQFCADYEDAMRKELVYGDVGTKVSLDYLKDARRDLVEDILKEARTGDWQQRFDNAVALCKQYLDLVEPTMALRPEATASGCRAYIEHNMQQWPQPVKLYYIGPMFRRERPQKGRYRQFYQIGAEVLETVRPDAAKDAAKELAKDAAVDAEVIEMLMTFFDRIGLQGTELSINSIGHAADNCRRGYVAILREELTKVKDRLGADSQRRIETNPLRVLDSKLELEQPIIAGLPHIADHLCDDCKTHYAELKRQLDLRGVAYRENWRLVRGLDYYMRTTFEITARGLGSQDAVCGGGRYDGLVELLGGPPTKGIGFAIGEDRVILSLQETGKAPAAEGRDVYIAWMGEKAYAAAIRAAKTLRAVGLSVELPPAEQKFGKALERASKLNARFALILGDDEVTTGQWTLKTLADGSQQKFSEPALLEYLRGL
jgi:histidyl-tRNA synthetase